MSFDYGIVSSMSRDDLYAELMWDDVQWGEITLEKPTNHLRLTLYAAPSGQAWVFDLRDAQAIIENAARQLLEVEGLATDDQGSPA